MLSCAWAAVFSGAAANSGTSITWEGVGLYVMLFAHVPLAIVIVMRANGFRVLAAFTALSFAWLSLAATFLGGMVIYDDWL